MTKKEIFKKAIEKAENNGYKSHLELLPELPHNSTCAIQLKYKLLWEKRYEVIFSHDFAKTYFGYEQIPLIFSNNNQIEDIDWMFEWKYNIKKMILEKEPIKYLEKFL